MKNSINKIKSFLREQYLYIIEFSFFVCFDLFLTYVISLTKNFSSNLTFIVSSFIVIFFELFFFAFLLKKQKIRLEKLFLVIIIIIGPLYLFLFPFNALPDDATHIMRTYEISEGHLISKKYDNNVVGRELDQNISTFLYNNKKYSYELKNLGLRNSKNKVVQNFANTSLYSFVCYLPQSIGVAIAKLFSFSIPFQLIFGRFFNFLTFVFIMYYAIKIIPIKKEILFFISLLPITLQGAISMSPDALTIAMISILVASVLHLKMEQKTRIKKKQIAFLTVISLVLSQCKIVYLPVCLLLFLIPKEKFSSLKRKNIIVISILIFISIVSLLWLSIASKNLPSYSDGGINSTLQLNGIISNPFKFLKVIFLTINNSFLDWLFGSFSKNLGCFSIYIPDIFILLNILIFVVMSLSNYKEKKELDKIDKLLFIFIFMAVGCLMLTSLYLQWNPVGNSIIIGVQGRYFVPILIFVSLVLFNNKIKSQFNMVNKYFYLFIILENIFALNYVFWTFI